MSAAEGFVRDLAQTLKFFKSTLSVFEEADSVFGAPRAAVVSGIADHTAHHRGALSVYARLIGKEPPMPYA